MGRFFGCYMVGFKRYVRDGVVVPKDRPRPGLSLGKPATSYNEVVEETWLNTHVYECDPHSRAIFSIRNGLVTHQTVHIMEHRKAGEDFGHTCDIALF